MMKPRRSSLRIAAAAALVLGAVNGASQAATFGYIGQQVIATGSLYQNTTLGGLSGIDYNTATGSYVAISDDRSQFSAARYYDLTLDFAQFQRSNSAGQSGVAFTGVTTLLTPAGTPFANSGVDPESIRLRQTASGTSLLWSNEGARSGAAYQNPTVREMSTNGTHLRDLTVPAAYYPVGTAAATAPGDSGIRNNLAFESLTLSVDGKRAYAATENALVQDGPAAGVGTGSASRVAEFDLATGDRTAEFVYNVDPVVAAPTPGGFATNGLVEMLAVGERRFLMLERSFSDGAGNSIRLYLADASGATNIAGLANPAGSGVVAMDKTLLLDLGTLTNDDGSALVLDNVEGLSWGADFNGQKTLVLVSDNNFAATQFTQFIALSVDGNFSSPIPEPRSIALMLAGLLPLVWIARRRVG